MTSERKGAKGSSGDITSGKNQAGGNSGDDIIVSGNKSSKTCHNTTGWTVNTFQQ